MLQIKLNRSTPSWVPLEHSQTSTSTTPLKVHKAVVFSDALKSNQVPTTAHVKTSSPNTPHLEKQSSFNPSCLN